MQKFRALQYKSHTKYIPITIDANLFTRTSFLRLTNAKILTKLHSKNERKNAPIPKKSGNHRYPEESNILLFLCSRICSQTVLSQAQSRRIYKKASKISRKVLFRAQSAAKEDRYTYACFRQKDRQASLLLQIPPKRSQPVSDQSSSILFLYQILFSFLIYPALKQKNDRPYKI